MFDTQLPDLGDLADADASMVIAAITGWASIEAAAAARRLAAVAELVHRRGVSVERAHWACDEWDAAAAEVAAALHLSHGKASGQMYLAAALRNRLPLVAEAFAEGMLSYQVVATIAWHTTLIRDPQALELVDKALAADAVRYGPLSAAKTATAIDVIVDQYDPGALRHSRAHARSRDVVIDKANTDNGTTPLWGRLYSSDAELLDRRLMAMAHEVCDDDPRTIAQRRADALGALAAGADRLACGCGDAECPTNTDQQRPAGTVIVHVVADTATVASPVDPHNNGEEPPSKPITADTTLAEAMTPQPEREPPAAKVAPAQLLGGPALPASLLAELIRTGAEVRPLKIPGPHTPPEPGYRPSTALAEFVRCRDMTCRFPACDKPAEFCDIDHAIAYGAGGLTHPSNLRCLCRKHCRLKTFGGWDDVQLSDGTVAWTSPAGRSYRTTPAGVDLFPQRHKPACAAPAPSGRSRRKQRASSIARARKHNRELRPINESRQRLEESCKEEIAARNFRNHMRDMLFLFKGKNSRRIGSRRRWNRS